MGPVISAEARAYIASSVAAAEAAGARVLLDGRHAAGGGRGGNWLGPTVLADVTPDMAAYREEIFGPVLALVRVSTLEEAVALINRNPCGNGACAGDDAMGCEARRGRAGVIKIPTVKGTPSLYCKTYVSVVMPCIGPPCDGVEEGG